MDDNDIIWMREYEPVISNGNQIIVTDSLSEMKIDFETGGKVCTYISSSADCHRRHGVDSPSHRKEIASSLESLAGLILAHSIALSGLPTSSGWRKPTAAWKGESAG